MDIKTGLLLIVSLFILGGNTSIPTAQEAAQNKPINQQDLKVEQLTRDFREWEKQQDAAKAAAIAPKPGFLDSITKFIVAVLVILIVIIVFVGFHMCTQKLAKWKSRRNQKTALEEASLALGIPVVELENAEHQERVFKFAAEKYSAELFRNRLSDLCGWVQTGCGWMGKLIVGGILIAVIIETFYDADAPVYAWSIVWLAIFFWISSGIFSYICKLLTGRFPGQARQGRKLLQGEIQNPGAMAKVLNPDGH